MSANTPDPSSSVLWLLRLAYLLETDANVDAAIDEVSRQHHILGGTGRRLRSQVRAILKDVHEIAKIVPLSLQTFDVAEGTIAARDREPK